jgi:hypothetical protein
MKTIKLYGVPGTGKTTTLTLQALKSVDLYGPDRVMGITFTRTAANELKDRIARARGLTPPPDGWARRRFFESFLPWVGTIHSLALKMTGGKVMKAADLTAFIRGHGGQPSSTHDDELEGYAWAEPGRDEVEAALAVYAASRHRQVTIGVAHGLVPWDYRGPVVSPERCEYLARAYESFKHAEGLIDFEDMLENGRHEMPPVEVVLADEVQDNSPLLWECVDNWSRGRYTALAGDPYQAIYLFSGAEPDLFINHPGVLRSLGNSRRLTADAATRAQWLLRSAGYVEGEWLGTWTGVGQGVETDGSEFYLARTGRLLQAVYRDLEDAGTPYGYVRGGGPLETRAADAFRSLVQLRQRGAVPAHAAAILADQCQGYALPHGLKVQLARLAKSEPDALVSADAFGRNLNAEYLGFKKGEYFERCLGQHGPGVFIHPPRTRVGTIHSAKGREADTVHLVTSWGTLPYRNATQSDAGRRAEGCVAYVGATRHRMALHLLMGDSGSPYPDL